MTGRLAGPLEAVVFDAGETLLHLDRAAIVRACHAAGATHVDDATVVGALARTREAIDAWLLPELARGRCPPQGEFMGGRSVQAHALVLLDLPPPARDQVLRELAALDRVQRLWTLVPGDAPATLAALRARGLRLAVVSNSDGSVEGVLRREGLRPHLELVLDSHVEGVMKPDPRLFRRCVERLGVEAARCAYVGDIYSIDVAGARGAGLQAVLVDRGGGYRAPACPRVSALGELLALLPDAAPGAAAAT